MRPVLALLACAVAGIGLSGCGAVALPFRVTADVARVVPVVGDAVAAPFDAVGDAMDRGTAAGRSPPAAFGASSELQARVLVLGRTRAWPTGVLLSRKPSTPWQIFGISVSRGSFGMDSGQRHWGRAARGTVLPETADSGYGRNGWWPLMEVVGNCLSEFWQQLSRQRIKNA